MMADYDVQMCDGDRVGEFYVKFHGPKGSTFLHSRLWRATACAFVDTIALLGSACVSGGVVMEKLGN